jgi:hypothetical protein
MAPLGRGRFGGEGGVGGGFDRERAGRGQVEVETEETMEEED